MLWDTRSRVASKRNTTRHLRLHLYTTVVYVPLREIQRMAICTTADLSGLFPVFFQPWNSCVIWMLHVLAGAGVAPAQQSTSAWLPGSCNAGIWLVHFGSVSGTRGLQSGMGRSTSHDFVVWRFGRSRECYMSPCTEANKRSR